LVLYGAPSSYFLYCGCPVNHRVYRLLVVCMLCLFCVLCTQYSTVQCRTVHWRMVLKWIIKKYRVRIQIWFICLRI
jgi:hypothetical protein